MQQARFNPDLVFVLIALGWVAIKFLSAYRQQKQKDAEAQREQQRGAAQPARPRPAAPVQEQEQEWRPFESFPTLGPSAQPAPPPPPATPVGAPVAPLPEIFPQPPRPEPAPALPRPAPAMAQGQPARPRPVLRRVQPAGAAKGGMAAPRPETPPVTPTAVEVTPQQLVTGAAPPPGAFSAIAASARTRVTRLQFIPTRVCGHRRPIRVLARAPRNVRQALLLAEVLGRPRAFDV